MLAQENAESLRAVVSRLTAVESSVGPSALCIRNLASKKFREGCVHLVRSTDDEGLTACGWYFRTAPHSCWSPGEALESLQHQRCDVCWPEDAAEDDGSAEGGGTRPSASLHEIATLWHVFGQQFQLTHSVKCLFPYVPPLHQGRSPNLCIWDGIWSCARVSSQILAPSAIRHLP